MGFGSRTLMSLFILVFIISAASLSADSDGSTTAAQEVMKATGTGTATGKEAAKVEGTITFIERDGSLVIMNPAGKSQIVYIRNGSKIIRNDREISGKDLKIGDVIEARVDSMRKADRVEVLKQVP